ncbi:M28 family peptidase [Treponema primitia]|uniref:M28 family peptidase n=1 Tax=Treponema primitia TaxID=88058 RepID=UPI0002554CFC|nr:M28 family peptidase [Treponema primitia]
MQEAPPYHRFKDFLAPGADRYKILGDLLEELGFGYSSIVLGRSEHRLRHFFVLPHRGQGFLPGEYPTIVLVAHYDRVAGSPGANDNSAAVFMLLEAALRMRDDKLRNWLIIFTDKEELGPGEGIRDQGSYGLAKGLRETALKDCRYYIFDACGSGDTLIISTMADHLIKNENGPGADHTRRVVKALRDGALKTARNLMMDRVLLVPTPFSDDAGFLRAGLAAQTITVLPSREAAGLASLLRNKPEFINALISRDALLATKFPAPETWRSLNGPADTPHRLTPKNYGRVVKFACELCRT